MRVKSLPWLLLLLLSASAYIACQKEYRPGFPLDPVDPFSEKVNTTISGRVINESQEPVEGALVTAGNINATTDYNGYFNLENITVVADAAYIKVGMQGYFLGSRTIMAQENGAHYVQIELIPIEKTGEFAAATGGTVSFPAGGSAIFPAGAIVRQSDGSAYTGRVDVSQYFIDPTTEGFTDRMPGDLKGITTGNEVRALQSFGMMAIQLNGEGGELLQVAQGKKVDLRFPVPANLTSTAPATIPLWFFDEEKGLWREEGSATKTGSEYIGQVSHFSFWNCDVPIKFTEIKLTFKDQAGNPQGNVRVEIKKKSDNTVASGFTDAEGRVKGWIPLNEAMEMSVYSPCKKLIHTRDIGPYSTPTDLGVIIVDPGTLMSFYFSASVIDCDDQPVANGFLNILFNGRSHRMPLNGQPLSTTIHDCTNLADSARITVYDADRELYVSKNVLFKQGTNDAGVIQVCEGQLSEFFRFRLDGQDCEFLMPGDSLNMYNYGNHFNIVGIRDTPYALGTIRFPTSNRREPYSTPLITIGLAVNSLSYYYKGSGGTVNITRYDVADQFMEGTFSAEVNDSLSGRFNIPMTGSFRVKQW